MKEDGFQERSKSVLDARKCAMWVLMTLGGGYMLKELLTKSFAGAHWSEYCYLALLLATGLLAGLWIFTSGRELDILFNSLKVRRYRPPSDVAETFTIVGIAVVGAALILLARAVHLYAIFYFYYLLFDLGSWVYRLQEIREAIEDARPQSAERQVAPIEAYYFQRPHLLRVLLLLAFAGPCALLAWLSYVQGNAGLRGVSYMGLVVTIIGGEVPLMVWRQRFYRQVREAQSQEDGPAEPPPAATG